MAAIGTVVVMGEVVGWWGGGVGWRGGGVAGWWDRLNGRSPESAWIAKRKLGAVVHRERKLRKSRWKGLVHFEALVRGSRLSLDHDAARHAEVKQEGSVASSAAELDPHLLAFPTYMGHLLSLERGYDALLRHPLTNYFVIERPVAGSATRLLGVDRLDIFALEAPFDQASRLLDLGELRHGVCVVALSILF